MSAELNKQTVTAQTGPQHESSIAIWIRIVVCGGALLLAAGAVIALVRPAMLVSPHDEINAAAHTYAGYFISRNLALAIMLMALLIRRARRALANVLVLVALVQLFDVGIDCLEGRWTIVPGVLVIGVLFLTAAIRLFKPASSKISA